MVRTIDIKVNAAHPELPLDTLSVFKSSPFSVRISNVPKRIGAWSVTEVFISVTMPSNEIVSRPCVNVSGVWVATLPGCDTTGTSENGYEITANGVDEHGTAVTGYCFCRGDFEVMERDGTIFVGGNSYYFHFLDAVPEHPNKGDAAVIDGALKWFDGEDWSDFANVDLTPIEAQIAALKGGKADKETTYTKTETDEKLSNKLDASVTESPNTFTAWDAEVSKNLRVPNGSVNAQGFICYNNLYGIDPSGNGNFANIIDPALAAAVGKIADAKLTRDFVNLMVSTNSAHYLTARAGTAGAYTYPPFASAAALRAALAAHTEQNPQFFYAGEAFTPTKNDWVIVSEDEEHPLGTITPASRYGFVGTFGSGGSFQYQVSYKLPLTTAQIAALDSEITKALVTWLTTFKGTDTATTLASIIECLSIPISSKNAGFTTESYKRFIVTVSGAMTVTLHKPTGTDADVFECRFDGSGLSADASITFAKVAAFGSADAITTMDTDCGTVTAGRVALMSAFWNGATWDVNWKVEG